jgi:hypothetical protein
MLGIWILYVLQKKNTKPKHIEKMIYDIFTRQWNCLLFLKDTREIVVNLSTLCKKRMFQYHMKCMWMSPCWWIITKWDGSYNSCEMIVTGQKMKSKYMFINEAVNYRSTHMVRNLSKLDFLLSTMARHFIFLSWDEVELIFEFFYNK